MHYDSLIQKSTNKTQTTWNIVKSLTNNKTNSNKENINSHSNNQKAANSFNQYFVSVADNIISNLQKTKYSK